VRVAARARRAHRACAPRAAGNKIGDEGAKELAAALKDNTTLTTLSLGRACSGAPPHPHGTATRARACRGGVRRAAPSVLPHALAAPHRACAPRAAGNQIGDEGAKELAAALEANATLTTLNLRGACSGAPPPPPRHRRTRARVQGGGRAARRPARIAARARRAHRACAPRAAAYSIKDQAALAAIESILDANKARPPASVRRAFAPRRDPRAAICRAAWSLCPLCTVATRVPTPL